MQALRQCDGGRAQCIVMVRDDFWLAVSRFLRELEVRLVEGENSALADLFDTDHARKVLAAFGRAFDKLPDDSQEITPEQKSFLKQSVTGLAEEAKVVCVRLALFAEMMKSKPWTPATLKQVGGTKGVGVTFLEETFSASTSPPEHRYHQKAARAVLKDLLPDSGADIKGHMRSYAQLLAASGYGKRTKDFEELVRILDGDIRLITPTDPEGKEDEGRTQVEGKSALLSADETAPSDPATLRFYQLTHDYLVPALRSWLTRKQKETRRGRAELKLADASATWNSKPKNRFLPSWWEHVGIRLFTDKKKWTEPQRKMMAKAGRTHGLRASGILLLLCAAGAACWAIRHNILAERERVEARSLDQRNLTRAQAPEDSLEKLHLALALVDQDERQVEHLYERLATSTPSQFPVIRDALAKYQDRLRDRLWKTVAGREPDPDHRRLRAAAALGKYDPTNARWRDEAPEVASQLVAVNPVFLGAWQDALRPVASFLAPTLAKLCNDSDQGELPRDLATSLVVDYAQDDPEILTQALIAADAKTFAALFPALQRHGQVAIDKLRSVIERKLEPTWDDPPLDPSWQKPDATAKGAIESSGGMLTERFAYGPDLSWEDFLRLAESLRARGYRPTRVRPWRNSVAQSGPGAPRPRVAAVWTRDAKRWELQVDVAKDQLPASETPAERDGLVIADAAVLPSFDGSEPAFVLLWSEPDGPGEQRRLLVDLSEPEFIKAQGDLASEGFISQLAIGVWTDTMRERRYLGIWSTQGPPSEAFPAYTGFERLEQPQWDVAVASANRLPDPLDRFRKLAQEIANLPENARERPDVRLARAQALFHLGQMEEALLDLNLLAGEESIANRIDFLRYRAWTLARRGKAEDARSELAKYLEREQESSIRSYSRVLVAAFLGERDELAKRLDEAVTAAGENPNSLYNAACAAAMAAPAIEKLDRDHARQLTDLALDLLSKAIAKGFKDATNLREDVDLASLRDDERFTELFWRLAPPERYAAVWRANTDFETKLDPEAQSPRDGQPEGKPQTPLDRARDLAAQGYRPIAIAVDVGSGSPDPALAPTEGLPTSNVTIVWRRPLVPDAAKEQLAQRQATAAAALLRFEAGKAKSAQDTTSLDSLFAHSPDPRVRSYMLRRLAPYGVDPASLFQRLAIESDVSRRRALILGIGEFARSVSLSDEQRSAAITDLAARYSDDPDPGVHGAAEWSLRQLGATDEITQARGAYSTGEPVGDRHWYLTKTGAPSATDPSTEAPSPVLSLSFAIVSADEFLMGSPQSEAERFDRPNGEDEALHRQKIGRTFAIGTHEVTVAQYEAFRADHPFNRKTAQEPDAPANPISWYGAISYCNWLSQQEGLPPEEWCYEPNQAVGGGLTLYPDYLRRSGYRLPTEAEWEFACRAGARTARYFGETDALLGEYAWYSKNSLDRWMAPVGGRKPNDFGLFDMLGNANEWCLERAERYDYESAWLEDGERPVPLNNSQTRIIRGSSFLNHAPSLRSAARDYFVPPTQVGDLGFRVARTIP